MSRFVLLSSVAAFLVGLAPALASAQPVVIEKYLRKGDWRTVETFINSSATVVFIGPANCQVKLVSFPGHPGSQRQTLDGMTARSVKVGGLGGLFGRVQVRVPEDMAVRYVVWPGGTILSSDDIRQALDLLRGL
jgi:hypothetical protein